MYTCLAHDLTTTAPLRRPLPLVSAGTQLVSCAYDGHASIAYGADWGWRGAGEGSAAAPDVVVSCSFYDKGLHVWSPTP